jgi:hypothetical protein
VGRITIASLLRTALKQHFNINSGQIIMEMLHKGEGMSFSALLRGPSHLNKKLDLEICTFRCLQNIIMESPVFSCILLAN